MYKVIQTTTSQNKIKFLKKRSRNAKIFDNSIQLYYNILYNLFDHFLLKKNIYIFLDYTFFFCI